MCLLSSLTIMSSLWILTFEFKFAYSTNHTVAQDSAVLYNLKSVTFEPYSPYDYVLKSSSTLRVNFHLSTTEELTISARTRFLILPSLALDSSIVSSLPKQEHQIYLSDKSVFFKLINTTIEFNNIEFTNDSPLTNFMALHMEANEVSFINVDFDVYGSVFSAPYPLSFFAINVTVDYSKPEKGFYFETH